MWISLTIFYRYNGVKSITEKPRSSEFILSKTQQQYARFIGLGLRFGLNFSAGINANLKFLELSINKTTLTCEIAAQASNLFTSQNRQRLKSFGNTVSLNTQVSYNH